MGYQPHSGATPRDSTTQDSSASQSGPALGDPLFGSRPIGGVSPSTSSAPHQPSVSSALPLLNPVLLGPCDYSPIQLPHQSPRANLDAESSASTTPSAAGSTKSTPVASPSCSTLCYSPGIPPGQPVQNQPCVVIPLLPRPSVYRHYIPGFAHAIKFRGGEPPTILRVPGNVSLPDWAIALLPGELIIPLSPQQEDYSITPVVFTHIDTARSE